MKNGPSVLIPSFFASFLANAENEKGAYRIRARMNVTGQLPGH